jgi:hypothetical protein
MRSMLVRLGVAGAVLVPAVFVASAGAGSASAAVPVLRWTVLSTSCQAAHTVVHISVTGAEPGHSYYLIGTSLYPASDAIAASTSNFDATVQINHGYRGFQGDLEEPDIAQYSNELLVADACAVAVTPSPDVTTIHPSATKPKPAPSPSLRTHIDVLTVAPSSTPIHPVPTTAPATTATTSPPVVTTPLPSSPVLNPIPLAAHQPHRGIGTTTIIVLIAGLIAIAGGLAAGWFALRRGRESHR